MNGQLKITKMPTDKKYSKFVDAILTIGYVLFPILKILAIPFLGLIALLGYIIYFISALGSAIFGFAFLYTVIFFSCWSDIIVTGIFFIISFVVFNFLSSCFN